MELSAPFSVVWRSFKASRLPTVAKHEDPIRMGILGAADIAPAAVILPARNHPEIEVYAVASRDQKKAQLFAKTNDIPVMYHGKDAYQELLDDSKVTAVYNPLPNALHYEWTLKALKAGKHVLLEKPFTNNAKEAQDIFSYASEKGLVVLEANHSRFHPANARFRSIIHGGELGKIVSMTALVRLHMMFSADNIRFDYDLGGGTLMDLGCYAISLTRYALGSEPTGVVDAHADRVSKEVDSKGAKIDMRTRATLQFPSDVTAFVDVEFGKPGWGPFGLIPPMPNVDLICKLEKGEVRLLNFIGPHIYHSISVAPKDGKKRVEHAYARDGSLDEEQYWSTYRFQLEAFVDKLKGREPRHWVTPEESIKNMECIDMIYEKTGLNSRKTPEFTFSR